MKGQGMTDPKSNLATLGVEVDTSSIQEAVAALNQLAEAAERANASLAKLRSGAITNNVFGTRLRTT